MSVFSFAKKDINAWKSEENLEQQFSVFKENLNFWNGSYFLTEPQLNEFYKTLSDSISVFKDEVQEYKKELNVAKNELNTKIKETEEIQAKMDTSIQRENSIKVFGSYVNKGMYTLTMYLFILTVLVLSAIVFILYKRSNKITRQIKKDYNELKEEYEVHKKNALDRYVKMNIELNKTRLELNKK